MRLLFLVFLSLSLMQPLISQVNERIDSLNKALAKEESDTGLIMTQCRLAYEFQFSDTEKSLALASEAYTSSKDLKFRKGEANALVQMGNVEQLTGKNDQALTHFSEALDIMKSIGDADGTALAYNSLAVASQNNGNYSEALGYYRKALEISIKNGKKNRAASSVFGIGTVYEARQQYDSSMFYYIEGQKMSIETGDKKLLAFAAMSIGNLYFRMDSYTKAIEYYLEAADLYMKSGNDLGLEKVYLSIGLTAASAGENTYAVWAYREALKPALRLGNMNDVANINYYVGELFENNDLADSSMYYYNIALELYQKSGSTENEALTMVALARVLNSGRKYGEAATILNKAIRLATETGSASALVEAYNEMAYTMSYLGDYSSAFSYLNKYTNARDSLLTIEKQKQILELQTKYETEKKEKENELLKKDRQLLRTTRNSLISGALLLTLIIILVFRSLQVKKRDNALLSQQKEEIETQKTAITDSIRYARRIQAAMLPPDTFFNEIAPDAFVLYLPRDIVSGDFYWMREISPGKIIVAVADCTGHGVPGAFMSMLGMSLLSDTVNRCIDKYGEDGVRPCTILNDLRERIKDSLRQTGKDGEARDGMDMTVCQIDKNSRQVLFAGANNPVYLVNNGELSELKGTRNPVGIYLVETPFETKEYIASPGTILYMFSDGYADQIGHEGSKFLSKNFKKLLAEISNNTTIEIKEKLHQRHLEWRKDEEQVDDILILGIRI